VDSVSCSPVYIEWSTEISFRENDITDVIEETFSVQEERFGELVTIELKPGGADIPVTEENKADFVE
jgi:hypothetical protein